MRFYKTVEDQLLKNLTVLSFILAVLIIFHHCFNISIGYEDYLIATSFESTVSICVQRYLYNFSECAVPTFFFISGFLFYRTYNSLNDYKEKIKRRVKSLLIPYLIFNILGYIKHIATSTESFSLSDMAFAIVDSSTMPLWFVRELIIYTLFAPVLFKIIRSFKYYLIFTLVISIISIAEVVECRTCVYWVPFYLLGGLFTKSGFSNKTYSIALHKKNKLLSIISLIIALVSAQFLKNGIHGDYINNISFLFFRYLSIFMCISMAVLFNKIKEAHWMKYSFLIYCFHFPIISIINKIILNKYIEHYPIMVYFSCAIFTLVICIMLASLLQRITPSIYKIVGGGEITY